MKRTMRLMLNLGRKFLIVGSGRRGGGVDGKMEGVGDMVYVMRCWEGTYINMI